MDKATREEIILSAYSAHLNRTIELKREIWVYKILAAHSEVRNCLDFIKETIETLDKTSLVFKKRKDPNKIAIWKKCRLLAGLYEYIKIAIEFDGKDKAKLTTVHGSNNLPTYDMEQL